ncbi:MAG: hypothetical protein KF773_24245 [Deltaproteobacteria bacterium]|nr:hypothetical protein [Deltaproteobacteria bacterium]
MNRSDNAKLVSNLARQIARMLDGYAGLVIITVAAEGDQGDIACDSAAIGGHAVTEPGRDTLDALHERLVATIRREVQATAEAAGGRVTERDDVAAELTCGGRGAA